MFVPSCAVHGCGAPSDCEGLGPLCRRCQQPSRGLTDAAAGRMGTSSPALRTAHHSRKQKWSQAAPLPPPRSTRRCQCAYRSATWAAASTGSSPSPSGPTCPPSQRRYGRRSSSQARSWRATWSHSHGPSGRSRAARTRVFMPPAPPPLSAWRHCQSSWRSTTAASHWAPPRWRGSTDSSRPRYASSVRPGCAAASMRGSAPARASTSTCCRSPRLVAPRRRRRVLACSSSTARYPPSRARTASITLALACA